MMTFDKLTGYVAGGLLIVAILTHAISRAYSGFASPAHQDKDVANGLNTTSIVTRNLSVGLVALWGLMQSGGEHNMMAGLLLASLVIAPALESPQ